MGAADWGFADEAETSPLKRKKAEMKADCHMFLETFASYFPDDYLVEKITKNTGKLKLFGGPWMNFTMLSSALTRS